MSRYGYIKLYDIADIVRCGGGVIYPAGTCYIQVSACAKNSADKWHITEAAGELLEKYAAVIPKVPIIPLYLREALEFTAEEFFCRYIGSNINIQMDLFKYYTLPFHWDLTEQQKVINVLKPIEEGITVIEREIERLTEFKGYFLNKMIPGYLQVRIHDKENF